MRQVVRPFSTALILGLFLTTSLAVAHAQRTTAPKPQTPPQAPPTVAEAEAFIRGAEVKLNDLTVKASRASWVQSNFITDDTEIMSADANEVLMGVTTQLAKQATRFDHLQMPPALARKMLLLKLAGSGARARAGGSDGIGGAGTHRHVARGRLRQGQVLPDYRQARGPVSRHRRDRAHHGNVDRSRGTERCVGGLAHYRSADARSLRSLGGAGQYGRDAKWASAIWARCGAPATT